MHIVAMPTRCRWSRGRTWEIGGQICPKFCWVPWREKAIALQQSLVAGYVARQRRARPDATPAEIIEVLEKQYLRAATGTGAAVGGVAAAPGVGTVLALTLSGGETAVFLEATALFALAVAEVH